MKKKSVFIAHVPYQIRGGEDVHVEHLKSAYERLGYQVTLWPRDRDTNGKLLRPALKGLRFDPLSHFEVDAIERERPDFVHINNLFHALGPRFLRKLKKKKIPAIMTVHNHRFFCTNGLALRGDRVCKACFDSKLPWRGLAYNCNRDWKRSAYYTAALFQIRSGNLLKDVVQSFIAPSVYIQNELLRFGIPSEKIKHIPHPILIPKAVNTSAETKFDAIYAGRLSFEKGIDVLLRAIERLPEYRFAIVGDGPLEEKVRQESQRLSNLTYLSRRGHNEVLELIQKSRIGILPSLCNEIFPLFVLEALTQGKRCVMSSNESLISFIGPEFLGVTAADGDPEDLARAIHSTLQMAPLKGELADSLRKKLSFEHFCGEIGALTAEL